MLPTEKLFHLLYRNRNICILLLLWLGGGVGCLCLLPMSALLHWVWNFPTVAVGAAPWSCSVKALWDEEQSGTESRAWNLNYFKLFLFVCFLFSLKINTFFILSLKESRWAPGPLLSWDTFTGVTSPGTTSARTLGAAFPSMQVHQILGEEEPSFKVLQCRSLARSNSLIPEAAVSSSCQQPAGGMDGACGCQAVLWTSRQALLCAGTLACRIPKLFQTCLVYLD